MMNEQPIKTQNIFWNISQIHSRPQEVAAEWPESDCRKNLKYGASANSGMTARNLF